MAGRGHGLGLRRRRLGDLFGRGLGELPVAATAVLATCFSAEPRARLVATHRAGDGGSVVDRAHGESKSRRRAQKPGRRARRSRGAAEAPSGKEVPR